MNRQIKCKTNDGDRCSGNGSSSYTIIFAITCSSHACECVLYSVVNVSFSRSRFVCALFLKWCVPLFGRYLFHSDFFHSVRLSLIVYFIVQVVHSSEFFVSFLAFNLSVYFTCDSISHLKCLIVVDLSKIQRTNISHFSTSTNIRKYSRCVCSMLMHALNKNIKPNFTDFVNSTEFWICSRYNRNLCGS